MALQILNCHNFLSFYSIQIYPSINLICHIPVLFSVIKQWLLLWATVVARNMRVRYSYYPSWLFCRPLHSIELQLLRLFIYLISNDMTLYYFGILYTSSYMIIAICVWHLLVCIKLETIKVFKLSIICFNSQEVVLCVNTPRMVVDIFGFVKWLKLLWIFMHLWTDLT